MLHANMKKISVFPEEKCQRSWKASIEDSETREAIFDWICDWKILALNIASLDTFIVHAEKKISYHS